MEQRPSTQQRLEESAERLARRAPTLTLPHPLPEPLVELIADRLQVVAQPLRIRLVDCLARREATVQELVHSLGASQQNVSQHLAILHQAGLVSRRKEGTRVRYQLVDPNVLPLFERAVESLSRQLGELTDLVKSGQP